MSGGVLGTVMDCLGKKDIDGANSALSEIMGRHTAALQELLKDTEQADMPVLLASLRLFAGALESGIGEVGKSVANFLCDNAMCIAVPRELIRRAEDEKQ